MVSDPILEIRNLQVIFPGPEGRPLTALRLEELVAGAGEIVTVVGESGSGKTTLLNAIAGLVSPAVGSIKVKDKEIGTLSEGERDRFRARSVGYVHQIFNLLPGYTALENVVLAMAFAGVQSRREQQRAAARLLQRVGMGHRLHHRPGQLSGGEQQRVGIARALANDPPLILADEPTANLDARTGAQVIRLLEETVSERGATLILATHDAELISRATQLIRLHSPAEGGVLDAAS